MQIEGGQESVRAGLAWPRRLLALLLLALGLYLMLGHFPFYSTMLGRGLGLLDGNLIDGVTWFAMLLTAAIGVQLGLSIAAGRPRSPAHRRSLFALLAGTVLFWLLRGVAYAIGLYGRPLFGFTVGILVAIAETALYCVVTLLLFGRPLRFSRPPEWNSARSSPRENGG